MIGAFAATPRYQGSGSSKVNPRELDRLLDTLSARCDVTYAPGFRLSGELDDDLIDEALLAAEDAEVIVACLGLPDAEEAEGFDRTHMRIPENQRALVASLSEAGKPVVVVLSNGAAVEVADWVEETSALLEAWLGGEAGALALAQVLTGEAEPSGQLTETLGLRLEDYPSALMFPGESGQVMYGEGVFVGYRGFDALEREVAFPFGFGLGYTTFRYDSLTLTDTGSVVTRDLRVAVSVTLTNTGERAGAEVVQVYVRNAPASVSRPVRELRGYTKVWLEPGETRTVIVGLGIDAFAFWSTPHERFVVESGVYAIEAGPHSRDLPLSGGLRLDVPRLPSALHDESTIAEWFADTEAMEALQARAVARTGERFALSEQMYTVVAGQPLRRFAMFPGGVLTAEDVDAVLAEYGRSVSAMLCPRRSSWP
ncbi:glycoside hydrolase family 3 C-terminal domain-containing protein [Propioniciclava flava]